MSPKIVETIGLLNKIIEELPDNCFFNEAADTVEIMDFENELGIELPYSYKIFLNNFNGGFICNAYQAKLIKEGDFESAQWNSNHLFGLDEIREIYEQKKMMDWKVFGNEYKIYPFIPFCRTSIGELLIFANPLNNDLESPVFDAHHEEFPNSWGTLYKDFSELFENYVANNGELKTTSYDAPTAEEFINKTTEL